MLNLDSLADQFRKLPMSEQLARLEAEKPKNLAALAYDWGWWARPDQILPGANHKPWINWLILAGRGYGKTRTGAETVRKWVKTNPYVNLIGATADDARDIMIEGESGILAVCPKHERPKYIANKSRLEWPNGARSLIFTADAPDRLRGKQHHKLWMDEMAAWRYSDAYDQASLGLRLGNNPQSIITTTPKPTTQLRLLIKDPTTYLTTGSTYDNRHNLAEAFTKLIVARYEGTRLGRQELYAEMLDDTPGALWLRSNIDAGRVKALPNGVTLIRIVVAIDPAVSTNEGSDNTGIVVAGKGSNGHWYVLADSSGRYSPDEWAREAVALYKRFDADRIIGEVNNGGDMIEAVLRNVDKNCSYKAVHASRGKVTRAEPIAALYEQHRVHHIGSFPYLEDEMCIFTTDYDRVKMKYSPDRMDALVWALTELAVESSPGENILEYMAQKAAEAAAQGQVSTR